MRRVLTVSAVLLATLASMPTANAASTTVTFTVGIASGTLAIAPTPAVAGSTSGNTVTGTLASVVTDGRIAGGSWTDSVSATDFGLVGAIDQTGANLVPVAQATIYNSAAVVEIAGTAVVVNAHDSSSPLTLSHTPATLISATTANVNVTAVTSVLTIGVANKTAGLYTGTVTQTVS